MGEVRFVNYETQLSCLYLSSCIAVYIFESESKFVAGAHIMLPTRDSTNKSLADTCFVDYTIDLMVKTVKSRVGTSKHLRAKIAGGAHVYPKIDLEIGKKNILETKKILQKNGIFLAEEKTGGFLPRSVDFQTDNFSMNVVLHDFNLIL